MKQDYRLSAEMLRAIMTLHKLMKDEGVPDPGVEQGPIGLSSNARRVLYLLDLYEYSRATYAAQKAQAQDGKSTAAEMNTEAGPSSPRPPTTGPAPQPGNTKFIPPEISDLPPAPKAPMSGEIPPLAPRTVQAPHAPAPLPPTATLPPDNPPVVNPPVSPPPPPPLLPVAPPPPPTISPPQPGGVPSLPPRSPAMAEPTGMMPFETVKKSLYLRNAKANERYEAGVDIQGLKGLKLEDAGGSGLTLDEASGLLTGTPTTSGDFILRLQGLLYGKRCEVTASLAVIPDPKSLWVSRDSDRSDPFWKPDAAFKRTEGDLLCVAASKRGRSHAKDGTFRDDDFGLLSTGPGDWHIAVVADGAGSAKFSRRGSKIVVDSMLGTLPALLDQHVTPNLPAYIPAHIQGNPAATRNIKITLYESLVRAAYAAAVAIEKEAAAMGEKASAFSTTLIATVVRKVPEGWFIASVAIGDGGAAVFDVRNGSLTTLTLPDSGEFAGQTRFLHTSEFSGDFNTVSKRIFFDVRQDFTAIALMTDGISDPKFPTDSVFADPLKWVEFWNGDLTSSVDFSRTNADMERQFLEWLDFWSPGNHDDRTLAVLVP